MMAMSGSGGFILQAIKMYVFIPHSKQRVKFNDVCNFRYDDPTAEAALMQRRQKKRPRPENETTPQASSLIVDASTTPEREESSGEVNTDMSIS